MNYTLNEIKSGKWIHMGDGLYHYRIGNSTYVWIEDTKKSYGNNSVVNRFVFMDDLFFETLKEAKKHAIEYIINKYVD